MTFSILSPEVVNEAHKRIAPFIKRTPLIQSSLLNEWLGHDIIFKAEGHQTTGAFKLRGALNCLLSLKEQDKLPQEIVAFSSGSHAQGVALAAKLTGIKATIFMPSFTSTIKQQAAISYGAKLYITNSRIEAEERAGELEKKGAYIIHPFDNDMIIAGQGTVCLESLQDTKNIDAIFAPCGGGGLLSGIYLAKELLSKNSLLYAGEPLLANDATRSYKTGKIFRFSDSPPSIADGVRSLSISDRTFHYLKKINGFMEVAEEEIIYWTQWLTHLLKTSVEPTAAVAMAATAKWLNTQKTRQRVLVMLSGGNISPETYRTVWENNCLDKVPGATIQHLSAGKYV